MPLHRPHFQQGAVHLPELGLWLDRRLPGPGPERVFVSHAHSDHIAAHAEVILSEPTARLMRARLPGQRLEHILPFGQPRVFSHASQSFTLVLLPAGHIFGSAMALVTADNASLLYTGDFKLRRGLSAEPCEPRHADVLIMETTFGRPEYRFPPPEDVLRAVVRFCREALDNDEIPVLLGYSLGKSQELLCGLGDAGLPLMLHGTVWDLTKIYEQFGQCFPPCVRYDARSAKGHVLLCPPQVAGSNFLKRLGTVRTAVLTGWAVDPNCRYRYQCDAAFALSDHADFPDLVEFVRQVAPKKVFTLHGFAADFAQTLRELGYDAQALSEEEQFTLALPPAETASPRTRPPASAPEGAGPAATPSVPALPGAGPSTTPEPLFAVFGERCAAIGATGGKLEKIRRLAEYLRSLGNRGVETAATWFSGRPFGASQNKVLQLGWAVIRESLCQACGSTHAEFHRVYLKHSDLGETARELLGTRTVSPALSLREVDGLFQRLHAARGPTTKTPLLTSALRRCTAEEARWLVKIITGDLRIGLKEGLVEEAIAQAFDQPVDRVREASLLLGDIGETARLAADDQLASASLTPFRPVKFMLASPEPDAQSVWERVLENAPLGAAAPGSVPAGIDPDPAAWVEDKYDGVRCQLHKVGARAALYSRDLKDITATFAELADAARGLPDDAVLDGEILAWRGEQVLPFAALQKRLGRREPDLFMREEVPIAYVVFDLLWLNGASLLDQPLAARRARLSTLPGWPPAFRLARISPAHSATDIDLAFTAARDRGNEGLMIKALSSRYTPGRRGLAWIKLKKAFATLDCVVIGAEYGHGKRKAVLSDYTFAVRDDTTGELRTIGKAYSGLTDAEIAQLTERFRRTARRQKGRYFEVPPEVVLEIAFDRLQPSNRHSSGLAMRFPRIVRIRTDKTAADIDTLATAARLAQV